MLIAARSSLIYSYTQKIRYLGRNGIRPKSQNSESQRYIILTVDQRLIVTVDQHKNKKKFY